MIRLTLHVSTEAQIHLFNKTAILIGADPTLVDLPLEGEEVQSVHLKLVQQEERWVAINQANDPFATLNDRPFGKRILKSGDRLAIGHQYEILFEILEERSLNPVTPSPSAAKGPFQPSSPPLF